MVQTYELYKIIDCTKVGYKSTLVDVLMYAQMDEKITLPAPSVGWVMA